MGISQVLGTKYAIYTEMDSDIPDSSINCGHYDPGVKCSPSACLGHINLSEVLKCCCQ